MGGFESRWFPVPDFGSPPPDPRCRFSDVGSLSSFPGQRTPPLRVSFARLHRMGRRCRQPARGHKRMLHSCSRRSVAVTHVAHSFPNPEGLFPKHAAVRSVHDPEGSLPLRSTLLPFCQRSEEYSQYVEKRFSGFRLMSHPIPSIPAEAFLEFLRDLA
jgi:hypothetical protein